MHGMPRAACTRRIGLAQFLRSNNISKLRHNTPSNLSINPNIKLNYFFNDKKMCKIPKYGGDKTKELVMTSSVGQAKARHCPRPAQGEATS